MKKILVLLSLIAVFAFSANAQDYKMTQGLTGLVLTPVTSTTVITPASAIGMKSATFSLVFQIDVPAPYYYTYSIRLQGKAHTNVAANHYSDVYVYGALENASGSYAQIGSTVACHLGSNDTCWTSQIVSSPLSWKFIKFTVTPRSSDTVWIKHILLNIAPIIPVNQSSITPGR